MSLYNEGRKIGKIGENVGADSPSTGTVAQGGCNGEQERERGREIKQMNGEAKGRN